MAKLSRRIKKTTLAEQVANQLKEAIISGEWQAGQALPTEPEIADQFGVSRAVVRDATRMLAAWGLVEAQHGRGVFVTDSQVDAFGGALLLALRRMEATAWDIEQFEQMVLPSICAVAAKDGTEDDFVSIQNALEHYLNSMKELNTSQQVSETQISASRAAYRDVMQTIYNATHNRVWQLLAQPILKLRNLRQWHTTESSPQELLDLETAYFNKILSAITSRDPIHAYQEVSTLLQLPSAAEAAMRKTPIGEVPQIPIPLPNISLSEKNL